MKNLDKELTRRNFISSIGKGIGLATLSSPIVGSLFNELKAATKIFQIFQHQILQAMKIFGE